MGNPLPGYEIQFPFRGVVENVAFTDQPPGTTPSAVNVRPFDRPADRLRGAQREGMSRWDQQPLQDSPCPVQEINQVTRTLDNTELQKGERIFNSTFGAEQGDLQVAAGGKYDEWRSVDPATVGTLSDSPSGLETDSADTDTLFWVGEPTGGDNNSAAAKVKQDRMAVDENFAGCLIWRGDNVRVRPTDLRIVQTKIGLSDSWDVTATYRCGVAVRIDRGGNTGLLISLFKRPGVTASYWVMEKFEESPAGVWLFTEIGRSTALYNAGYIGPDANLANPDGLGYEGTELDSIYQLQVHHNGDFISAFVGGEIIPWYTSTAVYAADFVTVVDVSAVPGIDGTANNRVGNVFFRGKNTNYSNDDDAVFDTCRLWVGEIPPVSARLTQLVSVCDGSVYRGTREEGMSLAPGGSSVLNSTVNNVQSAELFQQLFFVDGFGYQYYNALTDTVQPWVATDGRLPGDATRTVPNPGDGSTGVCEEADVGGPGSNGATCDLPWQTPRCNIIAAYRSRIVLAGKSDEPNNWFMSRVADPFDWGFQGISAASEPGQPISGTSGRLGEVGDIITALIPYQDVQLLFGGQRSILRLTNDPLAADANFASLSRDIGIAGPRSWTFGPNKLIYFYGTNGVYVITPNTFNITQANRISDGKLDRTFENVDPQTNLIELEWDIIRHGLWVFITPLDGSTQGRTYYWDERTRGWWIDVYPTDFGPTASHVFDGDSATDRTTIFGGRDSVLRYVDDLAVDDDGEAIFSSVVFTPLMSPNRFESVTLSRLDSIMSDETDSVDFEVRTHRSAQTVLRGIPTPQDPTSELEDNFLRFGGTWTGGVNPSTVRRAGGAVLSLRLFNSRKGEGWSMEQLQAHIKHSGTVRSRLSGQ